MSCKTDGCKKYAIYGYIYNEAIACSDHRILLPLDLKMINVKHKTCKCGKMPTYGLESDNIIICCKKCKTENMIDLKNKNKLCKCGTRASFGLESDNKKICCAKCKTDDMIDLIHKNKCKCGTIPIFGLITDTIPSCCIKCKTEDMIDLKNKRCKCGTRVNFGLLGGNAICCSKCKTEDMIDLNNSKCPCGTYPLFGLLNDEKATCCIKCKTDNMINIVTKKCTCGKSRPLFGLFNDDTPKYCSLCKLDNMINIGSKKCLCGKLPSFGLPNGQRICCLNCKTDEMINLKHAQCIAVDKNGDTYCTTLGNPKYDNYCTHCFANLFPLDPRSALIQKNSKELIVRNYINENFKGFHHDQPLWIGGCDCTHKRRIDHRKLIGGTLLGIEDDERQHKPYDKQDEMNRYDDIEMIHGGKSIFIRFNPDSYRENSISKNPPMEERLEALKKEIEKQIKRIENDENTELMEIIYMYYDC